MVPEIDSILNEKQKCIDSILQAITEMKLEKGQLQPRPTPQQVLNAKRTISEYEHELIEQLEEILATKCPYGLDYGLFLKITELKVSRCKKDTEIRKFNSLQLLELEESHRHYDEIITLLEKGLIKIEDGTFESGKNKPFVAEKKEDRKERAEEKAVISEESIPQIKIISNEKEIKQVNDRTALNTIRFADDTSIGNQAAPPISDFIVEERRAPDDPAIYRTVEENKNSSVEFSSSSSSHNYLKNVSIDVKLQTIRESLEEKELSVYPGQQITAQTASAYFAPPKASDVARTLTMLEEESKGNKFNSQLLEYIELVVREGREVFDISLGYNNSISHLPDSISYLHSIKEMNLSGNRLLSLPDAIVNLTNLTKLDINCNQLVNLPESIGNLSNLQVLDMHHNYFEELPLSLGNCKQLEYLDTGFNSLKGLSESFCRLESLKKCYLQFNQIKKLPRSFGNLVSLEILDVHFNQLEGLPESISQIHGLTHLNVSGNHFSFKDLPNSIGDLTNLAILDLSENYLTVLPPSFVNLRNLKKLNLQNNPLKIPPLQIAQSGLEAVMEYMGNLKTESEAKAKKSKSSSLRSFFGGGAKDGRRYSHSV